MSPKAHVITEKHIIEENNGDISDVPDILKLQYRNYPKEREIKLYAEHSHMQLTYEIKNIAQEVTKLKDIMKELKEENELIKRELNI